VKGKKCESRRLNLPWLIGVDFSAMVDRMPAYQLVGLWRDGSTDEGNENIIKWRVRYYNNDIFSDTTK